VDERDAVIARLVEITEGIKRDTVEIRRMLWGHEEGLVVRVDRLEQREQRTLWWMRAAIVAALAALARAVAEWFHS
jgi:hypothetical protein